MPILKSKQATKKQEKPESSIRRVSTKSLEWIDISPPTETEMEYLAENYKFHPLDLDDTLSKIQRAKIDEYKDYLFLVFHFPVYSKEKRVTNPSQLSVFIGKNYLITLHKGDLKPLSQLFRECQLEEEARKEHLSHGSGYILYRIVDRLVDYCVPILYKIIDNVEDIEDSIFSKSNAAAVMELSELRRDIISFRRVIWPMRAVLGGLEPRIRRFTDTDLAAYFGDMVDHVDKIWDGLDEYKEVLEGLNDTHDSLATNSTNDVMKTLTIVATLMMPTMLVASIYGMNIPLPFQDSRLSPVILILVMLALIGGMLLFFRRKHLI